MPRPKADPIQVKLNRQRRIRRYKSKTEVKQHIKIQRKLYWQKKKERLRNRLDIGSEQHNVLVENSSHEVIENVIDTEQQRSVEAENRQQKVSAISNSDNISLANSFHGITEIRNSNVVFPEETELNELIENDRESAEELILDIFGGFGEQSPDQSEWIRDPDTDGEYSNNIQSDQSDIGLHDELRSDENHYLIRESDRELQDDGNNGI
jgi:hypothetical protein